MNPSSSDSPRAAAAAAVDADRRRRAAILALPEAAGVHKRLAEHLSLSSDMDIEQVRACLAASQANLDNPRPAEPADDEAHIWGRGWSWDEAEGFVQVAPPPGPDPAVAAYEALRLAGGGIRPVSIQDHPTPSTQEPDEQDD